MFRRSRLLLRIFISLTLAMTSGFFAERARAQNNPPNGAESGVFRTDALEMLVKAGFGRLEVNGSVGSWVPFRVMLSNQGEPIAGKLVVHVESDPNPSPHAREFTKEINLPTGSRQFHEIAVYLADTAEDPVVRIVSNDQIVAEAKVRIERQYYGGNDQLEIAVVDQDATTLNNISSVAVARAPNHEPFKLAHRASASQQEDKSSLQGAQPQIAQSQGGQPPNAPPAPVGPPGQSGRRPGRGAMTPNQSGLSAHPTVIQPEALPRDFVSYDPIDVLVIGDAPLNQLTQEQARALKLWVASGGMLILTGGADMAGLRAAGLDSILPVEPQGATTVSSLTDLTDTYGRFESDGELLIMSARLKPDGQTLLGTTEAPLVAEKRYGSGLVRFVALNPKISPYRGWAGAKDLWTDMLLPAVESNARQVNWITRGRRQTSRGYSQSSRFGMQNFLFRLAEIKPPSANFFLLFLLFYILLVGPVNYFTLKWLRKLDLAWLTIPGVVILFTAASVTIAQISRGGSSIATDVSLVELHQREGTARVMGSLLIMPTSKATHEITFEGGNTYVNDVIDGARTSSASAADVIESQREQAGVTLRVPMNTWTSGIFQMRSIHSNQSPLVAVSAESAMEKSRQVTVKNLSDAKITKAVLLSAAGISSAFDLEPGQQQQVTLSDPETGTFTSWYATQFEQSSQEAEMFADLAYLLDREIGGESVFSQGFFDTAQMSAALPLLQRPLLVGFIEKSPTRLDFRGSLKRHSRAFYVAHL